MYNIFSSMQWILVSEINKLLVIMYDFDLKIKIASQLNGMSHLILINLYLLAFNYEVTKI